MPVLAFDREPNTEAAQQLGYTHEDLEEVLREADVVTRHVPGTEATKNFISARELEHTKQASRRIEIDLVSAHASVGDETQHGAHQARRMALEGRPLDARGRTPEF